MVLQTAWKRWKIINEIMGDILARVLTVVFYFTIFVPFAIGVRLFSDPLRTKNTQAQWQPREAVSITVDDARRQF